MPRWPLLVYFYGDRITSAAKLRAKSHDSAGGVKKDSFVRRMDNDAASRSFNRNHIIIMHCCATFYCNYIVEQKRFTHVKTGNFETGAAA